MRHAYLSGRHLKNEQLGPGKMAERLSALSLVEDLGSVLRAYLAAHDHL